jgi:hypothetical protein
MDEHNQSLNPFLQMWTVALMNDSALPVETSAVMPAHSCLQTHDDKKDEAF